MHHKHFRLRQAVGVFFAVVILGCSGVAYIKRQDIVDWYKLRGYTPPVVVASLATDTQMTGDGKRYFYVNKPALLTKDTFSQKCRADEATIVLGCYIKTEGIFLYDVTDERLNGVEQVTAAHEMLHEAYERLSDSKKAELHDQLDQAYRQVKNERILSVMEQYKKAGADVYNELHSILGTEVSNLPASLEVYYEQYFTDRSVVVQYAQKYETEFLSRKNKIVANDEKLKQLESELIAASSELDKTQQDLKVQKNKLDQLLQAGDISGYNAAVPAYNQKVRNYNAMTASYNSKVAQYKKILDERNQLAAEINELSKALDSRLQTKQSL